LSIYLKEENLQTQSDHSGDEERPLQRVNAFQPVSVVKRRHSQKKVDTLKRSSSRTDRSHDDTSSIAKMIETLRQSSQRDKQQLTDKIDFLQTQVGDILTLLNEQNELLRELKNREVILQAPTSFSTSTLTPTTATATNKPPSPPTAPKLQTVPGVPPPPPPPPPGVKGPGDNKPKTLAEQLAAAKLKKELGSGHVNGSESNHEIPKSKPKIDFSTELQNRLKNRTGK
jgi:hypothetical protein